MRCIFLEWLPFILMLKPAPPDPNIEDPLNEQITKLNSNSNPAVTTTETDRNPELTSILDEIRVITQRVRMQTLEDNVVYEWKFAARVLDRACLAGFTIFLITATCALMIAPKSIVY